MPILAPIGMSQNGNEQTVGWVERSEAYRNTVGAFGIPSRALPVGLAALDPPYDLLDEALNKKCANILFDAPMASGLNCQKRDWQKYSVP